MKKDTKPNLMTSFSLLPPINKSQFKKNNLLKIFLIRILFPRINMAKEC